MIVLLFVNFSVFYTANTYHADIAAGYLQQVSASTSLQQNIQYMKQADNILQSYHTSHDLWPVPNTNYDVIRGTIEQNIIVMSHVVSDNNPFAVQQHIANTVTTANNAIKMMNDAGFNWTANPIFNPFWVVIALTIVFGWIPTWLGIARLEDWTEGRRVAKYNELRGR